MTPWTIAAGVQPSYPVDLPKFEALKATVARLCSRTPLTKKYDADWYLSTHLMTVSLLTVGTPEPDEDLDLRFINKAVEQRVRNQEARATPPWTVYSDIVRATQTETDLPMRFEVAAVLWPRADAVEAIHTYLDLLNLVDDDVHTFHFWPANGDEGNHFMALERALCPEAYLNELYQ